MVSRLQMIGALSGSMTLLLATAAFAEPAAVDAVAAPAVTSAAPVTEAAKPATPVAAVPTPATPVRAKVVEARPAPRPSFVRRVASAVAHPVSARPVARPVLERVAFNDAPTTRRFSWANFPFLLGIGF